MKSNKKRFLIYLCAVLLWIAFIFCRSLQPGDASAAESEQVLTTLQYLLPLRFIGDIVRKLAHFIEFAILGVLAGLMFAERNTSLLRDFTSTITVGLFVALCDETIQLFIEGRSGQIVDVWIDIAGVSAGSLIIIVSLALRRRKSW